MSAAPEIPTAVRPDSAHEPRGELVASTLAADCIKDLGRGHAGARSLDVPRSRALFEAVFDDRVGELELGALLIALRVKGECLDELDGAMQALEPHVRKVPVDPDRPVVVIPTYNGARDMANLTPLLACLLSDAGVQVIVHGVREDPKRLCSLRILEAMGVETTTSLAQAADQLARGDPAALPVDVLSVPLARLLAMRWRLGVRNIAHTLAKLIVPTSSPRCLQLASYTHPEFDRLQHAWFERSGRAALVLRGTEGEVVANAKRAAQIDWIHDGQTHTLTQAQVLPMGEVPALPPARDAVATARWIREVLAGERAAPPAIELQVACVLQALGQPQPSLAAA